jgi:hypothetical protein
VEVDQFEPVAGLPFRLSRSKRGRTIFPRDQSSPLAVPKVTLHKNDLENLLDNVDLRVFGSYCFGANVCARAIILGHVALDIPNSWVAIWVKTQSISGSLYPFAARIRSELEQTDPKVCP